MSGWPSLRARQHDGVDHAKRFRMRVTNAGNALYEKFYDKWRRVCAAGKGK